MNQTLYCLSYNVLQSGTGTQALLVCLSPKYIYSVEAVIFLLYYIEHTKMALACVCSEPDPSMDKGARETCPSGLVIHILEVCAGVARKADAGENATTALQMVGMSQPPEHSGVRVAVVDPETNCELPEDLVGEVRASEETNPTS